MKNTITIILVCILSSKHEVTSSIFSEVSPITTTVCSVQFAGIPEPINDSESLSESIKTILVSLPDII